MVITQAHEAIEDGDEVLVITCTPWHGWGSWRPKKTIEQGVVVYRFWVPNISSYFSLGDHGFVFKLLWHFFDLFNVFSARIVRKILREEKPHVVHTHNIMGIGFLIPRIIQKENIEHVHTLHDVQLVEPSGVLPAAHTVDSLFQKVHAGIVRGLFRAPTEVQVPSRFLEQFYRSRHFFEGSAWRVVSNFSVSVAPFHGRPIRRLLFAGSLATHKGLNVLAAAWKQLPSGHTLKLDIAGDGALRPLIQDWAARDAAVTYRGQLSQDELRELYKKTDALVFPSVCQENAPNVIAEALSQGLYIFASDTGGVAEMLEGVSNAQLLEPGNADALAAALKHYAT